MPSVRFPSSRVALVRLAALAFFVVAVWAVAGAEPEPMQKMFIGSLMLCTLGALACLSPRPAFALVIAGGAFVGLRFISVLKMRYLESALMPADFFYLARSSLVDTLRHYPHLYTLGIGIAIGVPIVLWLVWRTDAPWWTLRRTWLARVLRAGGAALFALAFWALLLPHSVFTRTDHRSPWERMSEDARLTDFFISWHDTAIHLPPMSDAATARREWGGTAGGTPGTRPPPYPDIVQVLEESTFDPSNFAACRGVAQCDARMFHADARTRGHGYLRVHTFGGGTWVSEYSVLTGLPQDIFGRGGMYAPYVLAPHVRNALPWQLRRLGYTTIAVYPTGRGFLNGQNAYAAYGFDHLFDAAELSLDPWEESDAQMFAAARRAYDRVKRPGRPVFVMVLTVNQHGPHDDVPQAQLPAPYDRGVAPGLAPATAQNFNAYLMRLQASDAAMTGLEHVFLDREEPTVLLHFGDHQPSFNSLIRTMPRSLPAALEPYRDDLTYYMVKTNFDAPKLPGYPMLDIAFLPTIVLQAAGLPHDAYFAAEAALRDRCNGLFVDCRVPHLLPSYYAWVFGHLRVYQ